MNDAASSPSKHYREALQLAQTLTRSKWSGKPQVWQQEVTSRVMVKYLASFADAAPPDNIRAWLRRVVLTTGIDLHRADEAHPAQALPEDSGRLPAGTTVSSWLQQAVTSGPAKKVARNDLVDQILGLLEPESGLLVRLKYLDNLSSFEIAKELSLNEASVNTRLTRAKRALQTALGDRPDLVAELHAPMPQAF